MLNRQAIASMHRLIAPYIRRTPVIDIRLPGMDRPVTLKLECLQITGLPKARGAFANMVGLEPPAAGVTAASGGNHGIAVARAAATLGVKARIFVPEISSAAKVARIRQEGAEVTVKGARHADALAACEAYAAESGALAIHAYNAEATLLGQGTTGRARGAGERSRHGHGGGRRRRSDRRHRGLVFRGAPDPRHRAFRVQCAGGGPGGRRAGGGRDRRDCRRLASGRRGSASSPMAFWHKPVRAPCWSRIATSSPLRPGCGTISGSSPSPAGRRRSRRCCRAATSPTPKSGSEW